MTRLHDTPTFRLIVVATLALALTLALVALTSRPAHGDPESPAAFHLNEITKLMVGFNGDITIQAVEIKMIALGENLVSGMEIASYDGLGVKLATHGTFAASVPNGQNGDNILCATPNFRDTFGITPDLLLTPGLPVTSGQVAFEKPTCRVNVLAYGNVPDSLTGAGPTAAPPLPSQGAAVLVRTVDDPTIPTCPLSENAAARFVLRTGSPTNPVVFRNNARQTVNVFSTVTGVEASPPPRSFRISPNPFSVSTVLEFPSGPGSVAIYDLQGRLTRSWPGLRWTQVGFEARLPWDGRDDQGRVLPAGIYFIEATGANGPWRGRVLILR